MVQQIFAWSCVHKCHSYMCVGVGMVLTQACLLQCFCCFWETRQRLYQAIYNNATQTINLRTDLNSSHFTFWDYPNLKFKRRHFHLDYFVPCCMDIIIGPTWFPLTETFGKCETDGFFLQQIIWWVSLLNFVSTITRRRWCFLILVLRDSWISWKLKARHRIRIFICCKMVMRHNCKYCRGNQWWYGRYFTWGKKRWRGPVFYRHIGW